MSQENVELHQEVFDAVNRRDLDALLTLMDDNVESVSRIVAVEGGLHGHDGVRRWWQNVFEVIPDYNLEVLEVRDVGELTVAALRTSGHGAGSDIPVGENVWHTARWRSGRCVWWSTFYTRAEALEAVGLSE